MAAARIAFASFVAALLILTVACGSGEPKKIPIVSVYITPSVTSLDQGATYSFQATVTGNNQAVTWSVQEGAAGGSIAPDGTYTAPAKAGVYHVIATSAASPSSSATASINVPTVQVSLANTTLVLDQGATRQLNVIVNGAIDKNVTWNLVENATGGSVAPNGLLTAPTAAGTYHVMATSTWDTSQKATCTIIVEASSVSVTPAIAGVSAGNPYPFVATVRGLLDKRVAWSIQEGSVGGTIDVDGVYTPSGSGTFHIVATSLADAAVSGTATVETVAKRFSTPIPMMEDRSMSTATLLENGDVLITGGTNDDWWTFGLTTAEIFDHVTGTFRTTGSMAAGRDGHTAVRLKDGKVLIAGGGAEWWFSNASAEIFDPATEKFAAAGKMNYARSGHTATMLADGKVLIAGGVDWDAFVMAAAAEIYDPATGIFSKTGSMAEPRWWHTATLLPDGRVWFSGGTARRSTNVYDYDVVVRDSTEIYDPATGTFALAENMGGQHDGHATALLADGRILITGGRSFTDYLDPRAYTYQDDAHVVASPSWIVVPLASRMNTMRAWHTSTVLQNGQVLVVGGSAPVTDNSAELFNPTSSTFLITDSMAKPRYLHTATLLKDGRVLIAGGGTKTAEIYDPTTN